MYVAIFGCTAINSKYHEEKAGSSATFSSAFSPASRVSARGRAGQERSPSPQTITMVLFNFIVAEEATPRFSTAQDQTPPRSARPPVLFSWKSDPACRPHFLQRCKVEAHSQPGTADDNDVLIVSSSPSFCASFLIPARRSLTAHLFFPTCWIWRRSSFFARCSPALTRRALRAASARRRLTP